MLVYQHFSLILGKCLNRGLNQFENLKPVEKMANDRTTVNIVLYKSKTLANGEHPFMLRIIRNRAIKYISIGISSSVKFWDADKQEVKRNHPNREIINAIISKKKAEYVQQILTYNHEGKDYTPDVLITKVEKDVKKITVLAYFDEAIQRYIAENRIGTAAIFTSTKSAVSKFTKKKDLTFDQIDYTWLVKFETHLRQTGIVETSMSVFMRSLRTLYNDAILNKCAKQDSYPYGQYKLTKRFNTETRKRAIEKTDIKKIEALVSKPYSMEFEAQQYFLFSYYGMGINFTDIAFLKWMNIEGGRITYKRQKTGEMISFKVTERISAIIEHWRPLTGNSSSNYIFPILKKERHITSVQIRDRTKKVLGRVNKDLKNIGVRAEISTPLTTYVARHTFATTLKKQNFTTAIISEMMGHKTEAITQVYLKSFENSVLDEAQESL